MEKKVKIAIVVAVLGVIGYFGFVQARWLLFCMKTRETVDAVGRVPSIDQIINLGKNLQGDAAHYHIPLETMSSETMIEGRTLKGDVLMYFLIVTVHDGSRSYKYDEHMIENAGQLLNPESRKVLEDGGVKLKGC